MLDEVVRELRDREDEDEVEEELERGRPLLLAVASGAGSASSPDSHPRCHLHAATLAAGLVIEARGPHR